MKQILIHSKYTPKKLLLVLFVFLGAYTLQAQSDNCAGAPVITDGVTPFSTVGFSGTDITTCTFNDNIDGWFVYTASCTGLVTVSTCNDAGYDTALAAFDGCGGAELACNDDAAGCFGFTSEILFPVISGTQYWIRIAGFASQSGTGNITIDCAAGPMQGPCLFTATPHFGGAGSTFDMIYFDIVNTGADDIIVNSLDQSQFAAGTYDWVAYTTPVSWVGNQLNAGAWTEVGMSSVNSGGGGATVNIPMTDPFTLPAGETIGVAVGVSFPIGFPLQYLFPPVPPPFADVNGVTIEDGGATTNVFSGTLLTPRGWVGNINYDICSGEAHCVPSDCLIVTCPDDVTVDCIENYEIDVNNAIAEFNCGGPTCFEIGAASGSLTPVLKSVGGVCGPAAVPTDICDCPTGYVVVGYEGIAGNPWGPQVLNQFSLRCKELNQDGTLGATVTVTCSNGTAINNNTSVGPVDAGANQAMVGGRLRIGCAIDAVAGFSKPISEIGSGDPNANNTQMAFMGGTGGSLGPLQLAPNGNVIVGMQGYEDQNGGNTNNVSGGVEWRYAPIESCGGGGTGTEAFRYVDQPQAMGAANCPGTVYEIVYHVGDDLGNVGCCVQLVTIDNAPPTITVAAGGTVNCYEDIPVVTGDVTNGSDATVTTSCGENYSLKILPPVLEGEHECPGTTYTYGYRVRDNCGREVIANQVWTIGNNAGPSIVAPPDMTISCAWNAEVNPDYAEVTTGCTLGYTTSVSGPSISGADNCPGASYTYTYTVTDKCGRTASDVRTFTIVNGPPVYLNCPDVPLQLNCEDEGWENVIQAWLGSIKAESTCSAALTVSNNYNPFTQGLCINNGTKKVTFFTTDACGRTSICEGTIIIADTEAPIFVTPPQDYLTVCNYITQDKLDAWVDDHGGAEVEDCWDNVTWSTFPNNPTINCSDQMPTSLTVTFVATDGCGNKGSMDATFTALPTMGGMAGENGDEAADNLQLFQNQPNPFKDETTISFYLPQATKASLSIYDLSGKLLKQIEGDYSEGLNVEEINRSDLQGAGVLYYKLSTATETATLKMILLD